MSRVQKFTPEQVAAKLTETNGMVYITARQLGCTPPTVYSYIKRYASVRQAKEHAEGEAVDYAESKLLSAILSGQPWAIAFMLKTKGKDRGYVERQEIAGAAGGPVTLRVVYEDEKPHEQQD